MVDPVGAAMPVGLVDRLEALLTADDREAVVETLFSELLSMRDAELASFRALPSWQARVAAAHTTPRELRALEVAMLDRKRAAGIAAPTLLLTGSDSPDSSAADVHQIAESLADARVVVLDGQQHVADLLAPAAFAEQVLAFLLA